jgi:hypothetical protein
MAIVFPLRCRCITSTANIKVANVINTMPRPTVSKPILHMM